MLSLCEEGIYIFTVKQFESNLRSLLKEFSTNLMNEAQNIQQRHTARFVGCRAKRIARIIRIQLRQKSPLEEPFEMDAEFTPESNDSDSSIDGLEKLQHLESFIQTSEAFKTVQQRLEACIRPTLLESESRTLSRYIYMCILSFSGFFYYLSTLIARVTGLALATLRIPEVAELIRIPRWFQSPTAVDGKTRIKWRCVCD